MIKFGTPAPEANGIDPAASESRGAGACRLGIDVQRGTQLIVDDNLTGRGAGRTGARPGRLHGGRPRPVERQYFVRYSIPTRRREEGQGLSRQAHVLEGRCRESPSNTGSPWRGRPEEPRDCAGSGRRSDKSATGEKILALLKAQPSSRRRTPFASLGSGSEGNGLVVESEGTCVWSTAGSASAIPQRVSRASSRAVVADGNPRTHEHSRSHSAACRHRGAASHSRLATFGTLAVVSSRFEGMTQVYGFDSHDRFAIDTLESRGAVPHDARDRCSTSSATVQAGSAC